MTAVDSRRADSLILAVESSCDETGIAVVQGGRRILSNVVASQTALHAGGTVAFPQAFHASEFWPLVHRTRATVLEICAAEKISCAETDLALEDAYGADEVFCTGTMGELSAVTRIDNNTIGDGNVGPMTKRLSDIYARRTATEGVRVVD